MNSQLLDEIYRAKDDRRKHLSQLPIDEKILIIERLRDMAIALKAVRQEFTKKYVISGENSRTVNLPVHTAQAPCCLVYAPVVRTFEAKHCATNDGKDFDLAA